MTEIEIHNFKGIKECKIDNLAKINLFMGKNNGGKSAILESIYLTCREYFSPSLQLILRRRSQRSTATELWYGYDTNQDIIITMKHGSSDIGVKVAKLTGKRIRTDVLIAPNQFDRKNQYDWSLRGDQQATYSLDSYPNRKEILAFLRNANFIDSTIRNDPGFVEVELSAKERRGEEDDIIKLITSVYDVDEFARSIEHFDTNRDFRMMLAENKQRRFLDDWGDGSRFGIAILTRAMSMNNAPLLIEEPEHHQHPDALRKLLRKLVEIASENNLQLFISSHSVVVLNMLKKICNQSEFHSYHVIRDSETGKVSGEIETNVTTILGDLFESQNLP